MGGVELLWQSNDYENRVEFLLQRRSQSGDRAIVHPVVFHMLDDASYVKEPTFSLPRDQALDFLRTVMDAAWKLGVRPTGYDNDLGATKAHLADMRAVAFHKLGIDRK